MFKGGALLAMYQKAADMAVQMGDLRGYKCAAD